MIRLFVTDLDDTLFDAEKKVSEENQNALHRLVDAGIEVCIATGRMDKEILKVMDDVKGSFHRISQNGAFLFTRQGERLHSITFPGDLARKIYEAAKPLGLIGLISSENQVFVPEKTKEILEIESRGILTIQEVPDLLEQIGKTYFPSKVSFIGSRDQLDHLALIIHKQFPDQTESYISAKNCIDFMPKGVSKGNALRILIEKLKIHPNEVVVIGDSYNDISMFQVTPHSFAMEQAEANVRQKAAYTSSSVAKAAEWTLSYNQRFQSS